MVRFVMIRRLKIRQYITSWCTHVCPHKRILLVDDCVQCFMCMVQFHYHVLRLILKKKFSLGAN